MTPQEIKKKMTSGEWKGDHDSSPSAIIADEFIAQFYDNQDDANNYPNSSANINAIVTAVNATYGKGINPEGVEKMKSAIQKAVVDLSDGDVPLETIAANLTEALTSAKL